MAGGARRTTRRGYARAGARGALALLLFTAACGGDDLTGPAEPIRELPRALNEAELEIIGASNAFGAKLLGQVHAAVPDSTVFLSPLSASFALGMTMNGAAGQTRIQMQDMLGLGDLTMPEVNASYRDLMALLGTLDPRVELGLANAAFHRESFSVESAFTQSLEEYFDAHVQGLDFDDPASVETMNAWVRQQTANRIEKVLEPLWLVQPSADLYRKALAVCARTQCSFYDSLIVAAALSIGCKRLLTEDLQHGREIDGLRIENPFLV